MSPLLLVRCAINWTIRIHHARNIASFEVSWTAVEFFLHYSVFPASHVHNDILRPYWIVQMFAKPRLVSTGEFPRVLWHAASHDFYKSVKFLEILFLYFWVIWEKLKKWLQFLFFSNLICKCSKFHLGLDFFRQTLTKFNIFFILYFVFPCRFFLVSWTAFSQ